MKFTKMHGLGNDYVYVNCFKETVLNPEKTAVYVSDRHFGIGSDGLILIKPSDKADFEMAMYNADGSRAEMCGNGIRCVAKYVYDYGLTDKTEVSIETLAGIKYITLEIKDGKAATAEVDMGEPIFAPEQIPVLSHNDRVVAEDIVVDGKTFQMTCVSMGNPHAIVYMEDVAGLKIEDIGPKFESHKRFPKRTNTEFTKVLDRSNVQMRVWERGSGETLACGTGACATAVACVLNGLTDREVILHLLGGDLQIRWDEVSNHVFMKGAATTVFDGEIDISSIE